ncbi:MAG: HIRAN domain-containing protein [Planctomycetaceae bacterium]
MPMQWVKVGEYANKRVVGVTKDGRQKIIRKLKAGMPAEFVREPNNPHDSNAVAVHVNGKHVGYLAADVAKWVANNMDGGRRTYRTHVAEVGSFESDEGRELWTLEVTMEIYDLKETDEAGGIQASAFDFQDSNKNARKKSGGCASVIAAVAVGMMLIGAGCHWRNVSTDSFLVFFGCHWLGQCVFGIFIY